MPGTPNLSEKIRSTIITQKGLKQPDIQRPVKDDMDKGLFNMPLEDGKDPAFDLD